ncbi:MAG: hypothetical protein O7D95_06270, partial [Betaproteobacteria bacterium]|nr:hypothetical protein [Betaproteobacteria bacterium]
MALISARDFDLNPQRDISPLTDALEQALTGRREQQEVLRLEGIQTQQKAFKTTGAQFLRLRNLNNLTTQKTELAKLAQAALKRGEDITAHQEGLNINNQDEMNLFLTRIA